jgi:hypothetical protein
VARKDEIDIKHRIYGSGSEHVPLKEGERLSFTVNSVEEIVILAIVQNKEINHE